MSAAVASSWRLPDTTTDSYRAAAYHDGADTAAYGLV